MLKDLTDTGSLAIALSMILILYFRTGRQKHELVSNNTPV